MQIAIVENGTVTRVGDYRDLFPSTSFPPSGPSAEFLAENNAMGVTVWKAHDNRTQKLVPAAPYVEGATVYTVAVEAKTQEEQDADTTSKAAQVRAQRNRFLSDCDWTQLSDSPVDKTAWAAYRQALRDISGQTGFPWEIQWPHDPNWVDVSKL